MDGKLSHAAQSPRGDRSEYMKNDSRSCLRFMNVLSRMTLRKRGKERCECERRKIAKVIRFLANGRYSSRYWQLLFFGTMNNEQQRHAKTITSNNRHLDVTHFIYPLVEKASLARSMNAVVGRQRSRATTGG